MTQGYMLDTVIFNRLYDKEISLLEIIPDHASVYITHIQMDEINDTPDLGRMSELLKVVSVIKPENLPASLGVWGDSYWGACEWGDDNTHDLFDKILNFLPVRTAKPLNPTRDARIAVTAINNGLILLTDDKPLRDAIANSGYQNNVVLFSDLVKSNAAN